MPRVQRGKYGSLAWKEFPDVPTFDSFDHSFQMFPSHPAWTQGRNRLCLSRPEDISKMFKEYLQTYPDHGHRCCQHCWNTMLFLLLKCQCDFLLFSTCTCICSPSVRNHVAQEIKGKNLRLRVLSVPPRLLRPVQYSSPSIPSNVQVLMGNDQWRMDIDNIDP